MKANELTSSASQTLGWRPARAKTARTVSKASSELTETKSASNFLSSRHETALCSSYTDETLTLHSYCKQTLRRGNLQNALAGSVLGSSGPRLTSRRLCRYLGVDCICSGRAIPSHMEDMEVWVTPSRKSSDLSHLCWFDFMKANELTSSAPHTSGWCPTRTEAVHTMPIAPFRLTAPTSASKFL